jgi:hypothetical protein
MECQLQCCGATVDGKTVSGSLVFGEGLFEVPNLRGSESAPAATANDLGYGFDVAVLDDGPIREGVGPDRRSPE